MTGQETATAPTGDPAAEAERLQERIYAAADAEIWRRAVYEPLHGGWDLACIGGRPFLDHVACDAGLGPGSHALELGCGAGAACAYLALVSAARVTGIERNPAQCERARRRADDDPRLAFHCADATRWRAPAGQSFDAAFLLDTLSLIDDCQGLLAAARAALPAGRPLYIADLTADPMAPAATLDQALRTDGFIGLRPAAVLSAALRRAGFETVTCRDANHDAVTAFATIEARTAALADGTPSAALAESLPAWRDLTAFYLGAFRRRELVYVWMRAV